MSKSYCIYIGSIFKLSFIKNIYRIRCNYQNKNCKNIDTGEVRSGQDHRSLVNPLNFADIHLSHTVFRKLESIGNEVNI